MNDVIDAGPERTWTVFAKPWPDDDAVRLASRVAAMGFDGIELPIRDGFPVSPATMASELPRWVERFADAGLVIASVAGDLTRESFDACASAGIPLIRVMAPITGADQPSGVREVRAMLEACVPFARDTGVRVAVQQHHGRYVSTSAGLRALLDGLPQDVVGAAWDAAHSALAGEAVDLGFSEVVDRLLMVNLKNAHYERVESRTDVDERHAMSEGPGAAATTSWAPRWTDGHTGMSDWQQVGEALRGISFTGTICLSAQYTAPSPDTQSTARDDLAYARSVFG